MWNFLIRFSKYHRTQNQKGSTNIIAPQVPISTLSREANRTCKQIKKYTFLCASHVCNTAAAHYRVRPEWTSPAQKFHCPSAGWDTHSRNIPNNLFICLYFWHVELIRNSPLGLANGTIKLCGRAAVPVVHKTFHQNLYHQHKNSRGHRKWRGPQHQSRFRADGRGAPRQQK